MPYSQRQTELSNLKTTNCLSPTSKIKRTSEVPKANTVKKRRTSSTTKRGTEKIKDEPEQNTTKQLRSKKTKTKSALPVEKGGRKKTANKTFQEDDSWN